jgi:hypothetical protein
MLIKRQESNLAPKMSCLALVGRWLASEVGEGGVFTKHQLRVAVPQFEQADRRMRDLRSYGWEIHTNRQDVTLLAHELRVAKVGQAVWTEGFRLRSAPRISKKDRVGALSHARFRCEYCGAGLGDTSLRTGEEIRLDVRAVTSGLRVICNECGPSVPQREAALQDQLRFEVRSLHARDLETLDSRLVQDPDQLEIVYRIAQSLPGHDAITIVRAELEERRKRSG